MQHYFPSQRKRHVNGNLASWVILGAPPTSASLFWFYYSKVNINWHGSDKTHLLGKKSLL